MDRPLSTIVRTAATPDQAKVFVALLQAEGIPAYVDGDSLADEFAMSRRLMNLSSVNVRVPTASLEQAQEILAKVEIDPEELAEQAMAATAERPVAEAPPRPQPMAPPHSPWPLVVSISAAIVFLGLWLNSVDANAAARDPNFVFEPTATGMQELRRSNRRLMHSWVDLDRDGSWEESRTHGSDGRVIARAIDADEDGQFERTIEHRDDGTTTTWTDHNGDGIYDEGRTTDAEDRCLQTLVWQAKVGFVVQKP